MCLDLDRIPNGVYAAVIPRWIASIIEGREVVINGDGETSRDFCFVDNAVQANLLAAVSKNPDALDQIYNIAVGERTSLNGLYSELSSSILVASGAKSANVVHAEFRAGDVRHSLADTSKAQKLLKYRPECTRPGGYAPQSGINAANRQSMEHHAACRARRP